MEQGQSPREGSCGDQTSPQASSVTCQDSAGTQHQHQHPHPHPHPQTPQQENPSNEAQAQPSRSDNAMSSQMHRQPAHSPAQSSQNDCTSPQGVRGETNGRTSSGQQTPLSPRQVTPSPQATPSDQGIIVETNPPAPAHNPSNPSGDLPALNIPAWRYQGR